MTNVKDLYQRYVQKYQLTDKQVSWVLPTGSSLLDRALVSGGYPGGRIIELFGPEGAGKTTLGLHAMAEGQKLGKVVGLIDMECSLDLKYARAIGVKGDPNQDFAHLVPEYGEQAIDLIRDMLGDGVQVIVVDSVTSMVPKAEYEGDAGEAFMGLQARMMGQGLRKLTGRVHAADAVLIFINQVRSKIGVFFGSPEVTTGGRALTFFSSQRIQIKTGDAIEGDKEPLGRYMRIKIVKNKVGPPLRECQVPLLFGQGISRAHELFEALTVAGYITRRSSFYYYNNRKVGAGVADTIREISKDLPSWEAILDGEKVERKKR